MAKFIEKGDCIKKFLENAKKNGCEVNAVEQLLILRSMFETDDTEIHLYSSRSLGEGSIHWGVMRGEKCIFDGGLVYFQDCNSYSIHS